MNLTPERREEIIKETHKKGYMDLTPPELLQLLEKYPLYSQDGKNEKAKILIKYFNPLGAGTWLILEGEKQDNDIIFFGYCHITDWEYGYISLNELKETQKSFPIEIDLYMKPDATLKDALEEMRTIWRIQKNFSWLIEKAIC